MSTYVIGDIQACYAELMQLLASFGFKSDRDQLWFVGDLVNRGPDSLKTLRFVKALGEQAITVLGNHDLHLLALAHGVGKPRRLDTFTEVLQAADREALLHWLAAQPLMHHDASLQTSMIHAGLAPQWDFDLAQSCAREAEAVLRSERAGEFYRHMYGNRPDQWHAQLSGWERIRFIVNCFTRMRYCDTHARLHLDAKGPPEEHSPLLPWFQIADRKNKAMNIVFGHWSALGFYQQPGILCLDSGCLWGGSLTAVRLQQPQLRYSVFCRQTLALP